MPYIGQRPATGEANSFKILDEISSYTLTFDGSGAGVVSLANDTITAREHRFVTGQRVTYNDGGGTAITGLSDGVYYIIVEDRHTFKLASSANNAASGTAINLTGLGVGASHTLNVAFDGVNTKFKATINNGDRAGITASGQLMLSINGVLQEPHDNTTSPTTGYSTDPTSTIIFSAAPAATDQFFGRLIASNFATFDISDNVVDNFTGDGSTTTFTLSKSAANNQNLLVTIDGVVQYPDDKDAIRAYSVSENILDFASAPGSAVEIQVRHIGFAGATSGGSGGVSGFYGRTGNAVLKSTDDIVFNDATASGDIQAANVTVTGNLTVNGTTTTLDTELTSVDKLEVAANNTTVAAAITQTGTGDILNLYDGSTEVFSVADGGKLTLAANSTAYNAFQIGDGLFIGNTTNNLSAAIFHQGGGADLEVGAQDMITFTTGSTAGNATERLRITSGGDVKIGSGNPSFSAGGGLHVESGTQANIRVTETGNTGVEIQQRSGGSGILNVIDNANLLLQTNNIERLRIKSDGRVGINEDQPVGRVDIVGFNTSTFGIAADGTLNLAAPNGALVGRKINLNFTVIPSAANAVGTIAFEYTNQSNFGKGDLIFGTRSVDTDTAPTERVRITSAGDVGIGYNSPTVKLHVREAASGASSYDNRYHIICENNGEAYLGFYVPDNQYAGIRFHDTTGNEGSIDYYMQQDEMHFTSTGAHIFKSGGTTERLRITSAGNLLIGTSTGDTSRNSTSTRFPVFQVSSSWSSGRGSYSFTTTDDYPVIFLNSNASYADGSGAGTIVWSVKDGSGDYCNTAQITSSIDGTPGNDDSPGNLKFFTTPDGSASPSERLRITSAGVLQVAAGGNLQMASNGRIFVGNGGNAADPMFANVSDTNTGIAFPAADTMMFTTGGSERLRIDSSGRTHLGDRSYNNNNTYFGLAQVNICGPDNPPTSMTRAGAYLDIGGTESLVNSMQYISFGFATTHTYKPAFIGYQTINAGAAEYGDIFFATRSVTTDTQPTERLRITSDGKVKISNHGTNNLRSLSVLAPKTQIQWGTAEDVGGFLMSENNGQFGLSGGGYWNGSSWVATHTGSAQIRHDGGGAIVFCTNTSLTSGNNFSPAEKLRITSAGMMGLGTATPTNSHGKGLHIADANAGLRIQNTVDTGWAYMEYADESNTVKYIHGYRDVSGLYAIRPGNSIAGTAGITMQPNGNISIGTDAPPTNAEFTIRGDNPELSLYATANYSSFIMMGDTNDYDSGHIEYDNYANSRGFKFIVGATKRLDMSQSKVTLSQGMGIELDGGVINQPNDSTVYLTKTNNNDWSLKININNSSSYEYGAYVRGTANTSYAFGVNNSTSWTFRVSGNGTIYAANTSVQSISDVRLKENIVDANSQWDDIKALRFRNYKWKEESGYADGKTYLGLIAQEVETISPGLVEINAQTKEDIENEVPDPEHKNVKYSIVWMKAMKALQEAMERIETLEAEVKALKES